MKYYIIAVSNFQEKGICLMISKLSFFIFTLQYNFFRFHPHRKRELADYLSELSEQDLIDPCCEDILAIWIDKFGCEGILLGNISVFLTGFLLLLTADIIRRQIIHSNSAVLLNILSAGYCIDKFKCKPTKSAQNLLILLYIALSLFSGFHWTMTMLFLVLFINMSAYVKRGGKIC